MVAELSESRPRSAGALLVDRDFGLLCWGKLLSVVGVWVHSLVAGIAVYDATGSTVAVGLVSVVQFGPQLLFSPLSGKWADRGDAKRQLLVGRLLCLLGSGLLALWLLVSDPDGWHTAAAVLCCSLLVGLGFVIGGPAMQSVIPRLVTRDELPAAMALNTAPGTAARFAGPAVGAFLAAHYGASAGFGFAAFGHLVFGVALVFIRVPPGEPVRKGTDYSVRAGLRHVWTDRPLLFLLAAVTAIGFGSEPTLTLAPALADELGGGAQLVGWLSASFGIGAAVGLAAVTSGTRAVRVEHFVVAGLSLMGAGMLVAALTGAAGVTLAGFGVAGAGFSIAMTSVSTAVQIRVPSVLRGRVMALWMVGFVGSRPLAALVVGLVADLVSVRGAVAVMSLAPLAALLVCRPSWLRRPVDVPSAALPTHGDGT